MRRLLQALVALLAVLGGGVVLVAVGFANQGVSSRLPPPAIETKMARAARHLLIPQAARTSTNPVERSEEVLTRARRHFADHCASCHGNDGRGQTGMGRNLYPRAPDMTAKQTQELSDGELFWIIENGVKLTGMPAWGSDSEAAGQSWALVHFIRQLSALTAQDLEGMKKYNPLSVSEMEEMHEESDFLDNSAPPPPSPTPQGRNQ